MRTKYSIQKHSFLNTFEITRTKYEDGEEIFYAWEIETLGM